MKPLLLASVIAFEILMGEERAEAQLIQVTVAPPAMRVEPMPTAPGPGHAWVAGYWTWDGARYAWNQGHWERPPQAMDVWQAPRWEHGRHAWGFTQGRWMRSGAAMPTPPAVYVAPGGPRVAPMMPSRGRGGRHGDDHGGRGGGRGRH
jgi:WXXGXW repeat (2 copies)